MSSQMRAGSAPVSEHANGPFSPEINTALSSCFGDISGLSLASGAGDQCAEIGAEAYATGNQIGLGPNITPRLDDPFSMEVIGHEVAHALAGGGSGEHLVDQEGDRGEAGADHAGSAFRQFVTGGLNEAPSLKPATGGKAQFQRWESGEHLQAVDNTARDGSNVTSGAAEQLNQHITLANGMELTPGEITALMGDYYGVVDPLTHELDPVASMQMLNNADPEEMSFLVRGIHHEVDEHEEMSTEDLERLTRHRADHQSYLDAAQINDSHFSSRDSTGTDNNMGSYNALHALALENARLAAAGDPDAANQARMYEAMSMHYLTDRHASGHSFNKQEAMNANGSTQDADGTDGTIRNLYAKLAHDDFNNQGATMTNVNGDEWRAYGDGQWDNENNADNRAQTHNSVGTSYDELARVMSGEATPDELQAQGFGANDTVPEFSEANQERANAIIRNANLGTIAMNYYDSAPGAIAGALWRYEGQAANWAGEQWDGLTDGVAGAWNSTTDTVADGWRTGTEAVGRGVDRVTDAAVGAWNTSTDAIGRGVNRATDAAVGAWNTSTDAIGSGVNRATDAAVGAWNTSTNAIGSGVNRATDAVASGWNSATETVSSGWSSATEGAGNLASRAWSALPSVSLW